MALIAKTEDKFSIRKELMSVDFLVIDEFDSRHMGTEQASELFGRILEDIIRSRLQNKLPLIMCTNNPDVTKAFSGSLNKSISSLMHKVQSMVVIGKDFRSNKDK